MADEHNNAADADSLEKKAIEMWTAIRQLVNLEPAYALSMIVKALPSTAAAIFLCPSLGPKLKKMRHEILFQGTIRNYADAEFFFEKGEYIRAYHAMKCTEAFASLAKKTIGTALVQAICEAGYDNELEKAPLAFAQNHEPLTAFQFWEAHLHNASVFAYGTEIDAHKEKIISTIKANFPNICFCVENLLGEVTNPQMLVDTVTHYASLIGEKVPENIASYGSESSLETPSMRIN